ncbi:MAG: hypothetical protein QM676_03555 [Novosphingobium sp.]
MPHRIDDHRELARLLGDCLDFADRLDLGYVGAKIAEALEHLRSAIGRETAP